LPNLLIALSIYDDAPADILLVLFDAPVVITPEEEPNDGISLTIDYLAIWAFVAFLGFLSRF